MNQTAPLNTILQRDEAQPGSIGAAIPAQLLPDPVNYADNAEVVAQVNRDIVPLVLATRLDRQIRESEWLDILRMQRLQHDANRKYKGRSDAYLPIWAQIERTQVAALSRGLFPSDEYIKVGDAQNENPDVARPTEKYLQWEFEQRGKLRSNIKPALRQFFGFGTAPIKVFYNKSTSKVAKKRGGLVSLNGVIQNQMVPDLSQEGLRLSPRNIFSWYAYPATAQNLEECTLVFEDIDVSRSQVEDLIRKGYWTNQHAIQTVMGGYTSMQANLHKQFQDEGQSVTGQNSTSPQGQIGTMTELYTMMVLPKSAYTEGEDPSEPLSVRITLAGEVILEVRRNPSWHQRPPYVLMRHDVQAGQFYGGGLGRMVAAIQYLCNDFANQTNDVGAYVLNPAWKVVRGMMAGPMLPIAPGRVWAVNDPDAITPVVMDVGLISGGQGMLNLWLQMAQEWSGTPAIAMGIGGSKAGKTATQSQILQNNVGTANQDVVEDIEKDALIPMMYLTWVNGMQFLPDSVMVAVAGQNIRIDRNQLAINPLFQWLASSQAMNRAQRVQQALGLLQATAPLIPLINQTGYAIDVVALIKRVWTDGLGMRGFEQFIRPLSPQEKQMMAIQAQQQAQQMGAGGPPPGPPQIPGQEGDRVRSAVEQALAGSGEMAPGEGEEFMDVRNQADQMAGMMGGGM